MWFAYLYRRGATASAWVPDPDEVAAATTEAECVTGILEPPWDVTYELGIDPLPPQIPDIRTQIPAPVPRLFARLDTADGTGQTYEYVGVLEDLDAPLPLPPNPLPREPLEDHSVQAVHLLPPVGAAGQLLALSGSQELVWQDPSTTGLADGSVTTPKLATNAVTAIKITDLTITGAKLAAGTITADKLAGGVLPVPPGAASDTTPGLIQIATTAEVQTGTDTLKAVTPGRLVGRTATETRTGLVELATTAEAVAGTDTVRAVTPAGVAASLAALPALPTASEATAGILRLATQAEVTTGTDDTKALTPLKLAARLVNASETQRGLLELATQAEVTAGSTDLAAVTPLKLQQRLTAVLPGAASETVPGLVELATQAEVTTGTDDLRAVTPLKLASAFSSKVPSGTALSVTRYSTGGTTLEATPGLMTTSDGRLGIGMTPDTGITLHVAGNLLSRLDVLHLTANGVGNPYLLPAAASGRLLIGNNGTEMSYIQLPAAVIGLYYVFINFWPTPRGTRSVAQAGTTIRLVGNVSASGGYIQSQVVGAFLILAATGTTSWTAFGVSAVSDWTVG